jgi:energy-coupling factor transporter ATP-binding protein EcfA2
VQLTVDRVQQLVAGQERPRQLWVVGPSGAGKSSLLHAGSALAWRRYRVVVQSTTRGAANDLVDLAFVQPVLTTRAVEQRLWISRPAAISALRRLTHLEILSESSSGTRGQLRWRADAILEILTSDDSVRVLADRQARLRVGGDR